MKNSHIMLFTFSEEPEKSIFPKIDSDELHFYL